MTYSDSDREFLRQLGNHIRMLREKKGFSQEQLSFECRLHRTYIGDVERGERNIAIINLNKIAIALGVSLSELLDY